MVYKDIKKKTKSSYKARIILHMRLLDKLICQLIQQLIIEFLLITEKYIIMDLSWL